MKFDARYADNWHQISRQTKDICGGKCCFLGCTQPATETHHAVYRDKRGPVAGREIPGVHIFPLCDGHHRLAHAPKNWARHPREPVEFNRNTPDFYLKLREGWKAKITDNY